jgi:hypothetical protein
MIDEVLVGNGPLEEALLDGAALLPLQGDGRPVHQQHLLLPDTHVLLHAHHLLRGNQRLKSVTFWCGSGSGDPYL